MGKGKCNNHRITQLESWKEWQSGHLVQSIDERNQHTNKADKWLSNLCFKNSKEGIIPYLLFQF